MWGAVATFFAASPSFQVLRVGVLGDSSLFLTTHPPPCPPSRHLHTCPQDIDTDMELMRSLQSNPRVVLDGAGNMSFKVRTTKLCQRLK